MRPISRQSCPTVSTCRSRSPGNGAFVINRQKKMAPSSAKAAVSGSMREGKSRVAIPLEINSMSGLRERPYLACAVFFLRGGPAAMKEAPYGRRDGPQPPPGAALAQLRESLVRRLLNRSGQPVGMGFDRSRAVAAALPASRHRAGQTQARVQFGKMKLGLTPTARPPPGSAPHTGNRLPIRSAQKYSIGVARWGGGRNSRSP